MNYTAPSPGATARPFTVALCTACPSPVVPDILEQLKLTVKLCDQGLLVTTGCLLGGPRCLMRGETHAGEVLMMQPCSADRVARGPARWVGPVHDGRDLQIVCAWLTKGDWAIDQLPDRLRLDVHLHCRATATN